MIRTLLVDDSPSFRLLLRGVLAEDPVFSVVGEACNGIEAVKLAGALAPELVVMDFMMPGMTGLEATAIVMRDNPCPVVLLSTMVDAQSQQLVFDVLHAGAVEVLPKPKDLGSAAVRAQLRDTLRAMAQIRVVRRGFRPPFSASLSKAAVVVVGASTGGPPALAELLGSLPQGFPWSIVVAQHLATGFAAGLRQWLAGCTPLNVLTVDTSAKLLPGTVYLAADDRDLQLEGRTVRAEPPRGREGVRPSVTRLFDSALSSAPDVVAVLLTGMGEDGAHSMKKLKDRGAYTLAQDQATSLVYGMPRIASEAGAAIEELAISRIGPRLLALAHGALGLR